MTTWPPKVFKSFKDFPSGSDLESLAERCTKLAEPLRGGPRQLTAKTFIKE